MSAPGTPRPGPQALPVPAAGRPGAAPAAPRGPVEEPKQGVRTHVGVTLSVTRGPTLRELVHVHRQACLSVRPAVRLS